MRNSRIRWTTHSWNAVYGCSKISAGCQNCYAEKIALKYKQTPKPWAAKYAKENVLLKPHKLKEAYKFKAGERVFVNSMSDMFHEQIPLDYIDQMFALMLDTPDVAYQILTKRSEQMLQYMQNPSRFDKICDEFRKMELVQKRYGTALENRISAFSWPGNNIWLGVSVENPKTLYRIDILRQCPVKTRFLSLEPLLESLGEINLDGIHWVIVGGESGPGYRPMDHSWAREIRDQCVEQNVPFFFKQSAAFHTERGTSLQEEDGTLSDWEYFPKPGFSYRKGADSVNHKVCDTQLSLFAQ